MLRPYSGGPGTAGGGCATSVIAERGDAPRGTTSIAEARGLGVARCGSTAGGGCATSSVAVPQAGRLCDMGGEPLITERTRCRPHAVRPYTGSRLEQTGKQSLTGVERRRRFFPDRSAAEEILRDEQHVRGTLGQAAHKVRVPLRAERDVNANAPSVLHQLFLQVAADAVQHLELE